MWPSKRIAAPPCDQASALAILPCGRIRALPLHIWPNKCIAAPPCGRTSALLIYHVVKQAHCRSTMWPSKRTAAPPCGQASALAIPPWGRIRALPLHHMAEQVHCRSTMWPNKHITTPSCGRTSALSLQYVTEVNSFNDWRKMLLDNVKWKKILAQTHKLKFRALQICERSVKRRNDASSKSSLWLFYYWMTVKNIQRFQLLVGYKTQTFNEEHPHIARSMLNVAKNYPLNAKQISNSQ